MKVSFVWLLGVRVHLHTLSHWMPYLPLLRWVSLSSFHRFLLPAVSYFLNTPDFEPVLEVVSWAERCS